MKVFHFYCILTLPQLAKPTGQDNLTGYEVVHSHMHDHTEVDPKKPMSKKQPLQKNT